MGQCSWCSKETQKTSQINGVNLDMCSTQCDLAYKQAIEDGKLAMPQQRSGCISLFWIFIIIGVLLFVFLNNSDTTTNTEYSGSGESQTFTNSEPVDEPQATETSNQINSEIEITEDLSVPNELEEESQSEYSNNTSTNDEPVVEDIQSTEELVLDLDNRGYSKREIAKKLGISKRDVKNILDNK